MSIYVTFHKLTHAHIKLKLCLQCHINLFIKSLIHFHIFDFGSLSPQLNLKGISDTLDTQKIGVTHA